MSWMEHGLQILLKRYALLMEDKMAAVVLGHATYYGRYARFKLTNPKVLTSSFHQNGVKVEIERFF